MTDFTSIRVPILAQQFEGEQRDFVIDLLSAMEENFKRLVSMNEIQLIGTVDDGNSYDGAIDGYLGSGGIFTGVAFEILSCGIVFVNISSDVASAADGLSIQQSPDGVNWDHTDDYTVSAGANKNFSINPHARFIRIVYTNGTSSQTDFRLQTICKGGNCKESSHRIKDSIIGDDDCELMKAALTGENGDGQWHNIKTTSDGNLTISDNSNGLAIAEGNVTGKTFIHKFGFAPDFDTADGIISIWDGADDSLFAGSPPMQYTYSTSADIGLISSSNVGDTQDIEIFGLDGNLDIVTQTVTLNGTTDVDISAAGGVNLKRVFRMVNRGSTAIAGNVYIRTDGTTQTAGVPDTASSVRAIIRNGNNQTLMAVYTIPNGKTGYLRSWYASLAGAKKTSTHVIHLDARPLGEVFQLKHVSSLVAAGTSNVQHAYIEPEVFQAGTDIEMQSNTDEDQAAISAGFDIVLVDN